MGSRTGSSLDLDSKGGRERQKFSGLGSPSSSKAVKGKEKKGKKSMAKYIMNLETPKTEKILKIGREKERLPTKEQLE